ncbi:hypothetical protein C1645_842336 [Glomus cerebriforme]|uniref:Uncharacterized protein n=1 Tax=Glomus cerebriforme TaxID=658196 RepID=A0A397S8Z7_9GLOM|nr:hypothetical protein C1645_842336 [Glomus cerebriforme]
MPDMPQNWTSRNTTPIPDDLKTLGIVICMSNESHNQLLVVLLLIVLLGNTTYCHANFGNDLPLNFHYIEEYNLNNGNNYEEVELEEVEEEKEKQVEEEEKIIII